MWNAMRLSIRPPCRKRCRAKAPLIFVFHGHGDNAWFATEQFPFQTLWPEAIVVFPQGIPTPAASDPAGERRGWQHQPGEVGDRDLKLFDAMLHSLRWKFRIDDRRVYACGFSNGGFFDYVLWSQRGKLFAALAPCAPRPGAPCCTGNRADSQARAGGRGRTGLSACLFDEQRKTIDALRADQWLQVGTGSLGDRGGRSTAYAGRRARGGLYSSAPDMLCGGRPAELVAKFFQEHTLPR